MKITPTVSYLWTCTLLLYTLIRECPADSEMITSQTVRARLGHSASLTCQAKEKVNVVQSQWSRCPDHIILVYKEQPGAHVVNQSYNGHVSTEGYHTLILNRVQEGDFGEYCCKLTTYPSGSLEGRVLLLEEDEKEDEKYGLPVMMIVYISCGAAGFVVLMGIIIGLVCRKRRRKVRNPIRVPVQPSGVPQNKQEKGDPVEVCDEGDDDEGGMYLNVPQLDS
ncbi:T-cell immunoreceptor with Ig and ITIM domains-like isoform X2 [Colossoma macropomum]|uniref:T-cell immunoreceptor with Ig and ITIM domains-like isoform X2 n=1 Tax=Colossoma macropomum TaxID=42526 RepID=UPI001864CCEC|nr:T-cell immunoreceptor with Ig and ITIM domains-like isoform X2 [Colossoma macropomum]